MHDGLHKQHLHTSTQTVHVQTDLVYNKHLFQWCAIWLYTSNTRQKRVCVFTGKQNNIAFYFLGLYSIMANGHVSVAKKNVWHSSVLFTGAAKFSFSTPHISTTTRLLCILNLYIFSFIYTTSLAKFEENPFSSSRDICSQFSSHFSSSHN